MSSTEAAALMLQVRPLPNQSQQDDDMQIIVSQMHQKFKGFRHITEQGLLDPAEEDGNDAMDTAQDGDTTVPTKPEDEKGTLEFIAAKRASMIQHQAVALNETLMLLDFISHLESTFKRHPAEQTISEFLKKSLPIGSLSAENWVPTLDKKAQRIKEEEQRQITNGWKSESLSKAADSLLSAATRLRDNVEKETKYWEQILNVQKEGWTLFKSPMERTQLGVQTASIEAGPLFRERGLITLKADSDGHIRLKHLAATEPKMIRVRIKRDGKVVGTSKGLVENTEINEESDQSVPLGTRLKHARDSLFEEELFHEMTIETRNLVPYGVEARNRTIHFQSSPQSAASDSDEILVDLVSQYGNECETTIMESDDLAQSLALALRLLLSNFHQNRLRRRTTKPPPMTLKPRPEPTPLIIMPLLTTIRHQYAVRHVEDLLRSFSEVLQKAGFPSIPERATSIRDGPESSLNQPIIRASPNDVLSLRKTESFLLELPSSCTPVDGITTTKYSIGVELVTQLIDGPMGTAYAIQLPPPLTTKLYPQSYGAARRFQTSDINSLFAQITEFISLDLIHNVLAIKFSPWAPKGSDPWLTSSREVDGKTRETSIFVRMALGAGQDAKTQQASLEVHRSVAGETGTADTVKWNDSQANQKLVDVVASWINNWESK
jgi:mediator of RNA polymerase II transcription subunit 17